VLIYAAIFLLIALVAAMFGFGWISATTIGVGKLVLVVLVVGLLVSIATGSRLAS
jgi:uncharacterized membrane protein YtjA (UPF0391 family)